MHGHDHDFDDEFRDALQRYFNDKRDLHRLHRHSHQYGSSLDRKRHAGLHGNRGISAEEV